MGKTTWFFFSFYRWIKDLLFFLSYFFLIHLVWCYLFIYLFCHLADSSLALKRLLHSYAHNSSRLRQSSAVVADKVMLYPGHGVTEGRLSAIAALAVTLWWKCLSNLWTGLHCIRLYLSTPKYTLKKYMHIYMYMHSQLIESRRSHLQVALVGVL